MVRGVTTLRYTLGVVLLLLPLLIVALLVAVGVPLRCCALLLMVPIADVTSAVLWLGRYCRCGGVRCYGVPFLDVATLIAVYLIVSAG
ncbi:hypothetical protein AVEN_64035-1 [Araneus ventricosus]|uniref:Uncharacterized protein n=1 Tax=Araneus ventricosus TaxID=182803 RepID=A0A4Y2WIK5_ARAVE|nr:hypothetical protein AVEN_64035-1 [Araneus ventricosus]